MASSFFGNIFGKLTKAACFALLPVALISTCNGCHPAVRQAKVQAELAVDPPLKGRILIDPDFSGPERALIVKGIRMWTDPLPDMMRMEISEDPGPELFESMIHQRLVLQQERAASGLPEPDEGEEDSWVDPHSAWDPFDPRTQFWSVDQGCTDRVVVLRYTSDSPRVKMIEKDSVGKLVGHTDNSCHRKGIMLVVDRLKTSEEFAEVMAHEFGHMMGLRHDFEHNASIMYPTNRAPASCVTRRDVDSFCARWHCPAGRTRMTQAKSCG